MQRDWKSMCYEADPGMRGRETKLVYVSKGGTKFYRSNYMYEHTFTIQSANGTVYRIRTDGNSISTETAYGKSPDHFLFQTPNGTTYDMRVDNDGVLYVQTTDDTTDSTREYLAKDGGSYYLKADNSGTLYLETFA